ncbi:MAG: DUF58 domain-containing protein [Bdellovibrionota bacterium]|nr:MAG: DUF58 domain-containing protein [Bdellovibrionota bacterium]
MLPANFTPAYLRQLELLKIRSRRAFLGSRQGGHVSPKRGHGIEFADYRKYELGDNPRHIDWGVYARSDRVYVKRFQEEQDLSVLVLLDDSASMDTPSGSGKWQRAKDIALSFAYIALMQQDRVCVSIPSSGDQPFSSGPRAIHRIAETLESATVGAQYDFLSSAQRAISRVGFPGVAIFISDLLMPLENTIAILDAMRARNLDITVVQLLGPEDREISEGAMVAVDSETGEQLEIVVDQRLREEYRALMDSFNARLVDYFHSHSIAYVLCDARQPLTEFVVENLIRTGLVV